jgi:hypothetical protein
MRFQAVVVATVLITLAVSHFAPNQDPSLPNLDIGPPPSHARLQRRVDLALERNKAWCKGVKLAQAMIKSKRKPAPTSTPHAAPGTATSSLQSLPRLQRSSALPQ